MSRLSRLKGPAGVAGTILAARAGQRVPLKVTHLLTYRCNTECHFCTRISIPSHEMEMDQITEMMTEFRRLGTRYWVFNGGEPLLRKDVDRAVSHGRALGLNLSMVSNGTLLKKRLDTVSKLDLLICSIHGTEEEHDRIVAKQGAYRAAIDGLRRVREAGVSVALMVVMNEHNRALLEDLLRLAEDLDAGMAVQPVMPTRLGGAEIDREDLMPRVEAMRSAVDWLLEEKRAGRPISASPAYLDAVRDAWPDRPFDVPCWAGKLYCEVTPEGYVVPCCSEEEYTFPQCYGPAVGWERAFLSLPDRSACRACTFKGPQELNLLLGLRPRQVARAVSNTLQGRLLWD